MGRHGGFGELSTSSRCGFQSRAAFEIGDLGASPFMTGLPESTATGPARRKCVAAVGGLRGRAPLEKWPTFSL
jgi:hypothetical protein